MASDMVRVRNRVLTSTALVGEDRFTRADAAMLLRNQAIDGRQPSAMQGLRHVAMEGDGEAQAIAKGGVRELEELAKREFRDRPA
ncbi:MAG: hypothetical protein KGH72_01360 [Candidatus Micrarchaeota archaeon]|nr:hypothetical protein [Candidatus Micrarchaeota archaeon]